MAPRVAQHSLAFPSFAGAALTVNIGWLGLHRLVTFGGTGYFPARMLREHELRGRVYRVAGAPEFRLTTYLWFPTKVVSEPFSLALDTIRQVAAEARSIQFEVGDQVRWNSEAGHVSGRIIKTHTRDTAYKGHPRHASRDDPQYQIKSDNIDHVVMHKGAAVHEID